MCIVLDTAQAAERQCKCSLMWMIVKDETTPSSREVHSSIVEMIDQSDREKLDLYARAIPILLFCFSQVQASQRASWFAPKTTHHFKINATITPPGWQR